MATGQWEVGQMVEVQSRTWAGINKPGGCAKIINIHFTGDGKNVEGIDVKYVVSGGNEKQIDPSIISLYESLHRGGRKRRGRDFLLQKAENLVNKIKGGQTAAKDHNVAGNKKNTQNKRRKFQKFKEPARESTATATTPSTPVTPDHKPKVVAASKPPPVPSYVIADHTVEVSPLPIDRSCAVKAKTTTVARRGLFGKSVPAEKMLQDANSRKVADKVEAKPTADVKKESAKPTVKTAVVAVSTATKKALTKVSTKQREQSSAMASKPSARPLGATDKFNLARQRPAERDRKLAAKPKKSQPKPSKQIRGDKINWKAVYESDYQKAIEFMDELVGARDEDIIGNESKANSTAKKPAAPSRYEVFLSIFGKLRMKIDDGTIEENEFQKLVNTQASLPFSVDEANTHIERLCDEGKLMRSEGTLYIID